MILQQQLGNPQHLAVSGTFSLSLGSVNAGLLGNQLGQAPSWQAFTDTLLGEYYKQRSASQPSLKLAILKEQQFRAEGRGQRIATSLAALNAPQPTQLSASEWKEIVEEIEDIED
jgi:hypothetical protein